VSEHKQAVMDVAVTRSCAASIKQLHRHIVQKLHCCSAMQILTFKESLAVWRSISFLGHFLMIALILVSIVLPPRTPKKSKPAVKDEQHQQKPESQSSLKTNWAADTNTAPPAPAAH